MCEKEGKGEVEKEIVRERLCEKERDKENEKEIERECV